mmetsp:Transcript_66319/g.181883  ORF Transcript_66319/g.181883 Transcript_66319/m.181883 type:complete len:242 (-) Transcript_66319:33-758(-)|eukprot:4951829-Prymnesium_polylepis.1
MRVRRSGGRWWRPTESTDRGFDGVAPCDEPDHTSSPTTDRGGGGGAGERGGGAGRPRPLAHSLPACARAPLCGRTGGGHTPPHATTGQRVARRASQRKGARASLPRHANGQQSCSRRGTTHASMRRLLVHTYAPSRVCGARRAQPTAVLCIWVADCGGKSRLRRCDSRVWPITVTLGRRVYGHRPLYVMHLLRVREIVFVCAVLLCVFSTCDTGCGCPIGVAMKLNLSVASRISLYCTSLR